MSAPTLRQQLSDCIEAMRIEREAYDARQHSHTFLTRTEHRRASKELGDQLAALDVTLREVDQERAICHRNHVGLVDGMPGVVRARDAERGMRRLHVRRLRIAVLCVACALFVAFCMLVFAMWTPPVTR